MRLINFLNEKRFISTNVTVEDIVNNCSSIINFYKTSLQRLYYTTDRTAELFRITTEMKELPEKTINYNLLMKNALNIDNEETITCYASPINMTGHTLFPSDEFKFYWSTDIKNTRELEWEKLVTSGNNYDIAVVLVWANNYLRADKKQFERVLNAQYVKNFIKEYVSKSPQISNNRTLIDPDNIWDDVVAEILTLYPTCFDDFVQNHYEFGDMNDLPKAMSLNNDIQICSAEFYCVSNKEHVKQIIGGLH